MTAASGTTLDLITVGRICVDLYANEAGDDPLHQPTVRGLVIGRSLLYPASGDVAGAVSRTADLVRQTGKDRQ